MTEIAMVPPRSPSSRVDPASAYRRPLSTRPVVLQLDANEGPRPAMDLIAALQSAGPEVVRRYPDVTALEARLGAELGIAPERVAVLAGADDVIDRACRAFLAPGRAMVLPEPTFTMFERYATLAGADLVRVPWPRGPFPTEAVLGSLDERTGMVVMVSPNNPTGAVATATDLERVAQAAPDAIVLLDLAYAEYAEEDLTAVATRFPNVLVARTFSKARGLAGCRVGYAVGDARVVAILRASGSPYPVAGPSAALAGAHLDLGGPSLSAHVTRIQGERRTLEAELRKMHVAVEPSQANFVFADLGPRASLVHEGLSALGIRVRDFTSCPGLETSLRITMPGDAGEFGYLITALRTCLDPEALLFDLDGVLADVEASYRMCVRETARSFGVAISREDVLEATLAGNANNDWELTRRLLAAHGLDIPLERVTERFQHIYLGADGTPGLRERERLIVPRALLERLARRLPLAIVTGRPREEAEWFLVRSGIRELLSAVVALEDAPLKPDPAPVRLALDRLGVTRAWMVGDTPDDMRAAAGAGVLPLGVTAPNECRDRVEPALIAAGGALVLDHLTTLERLLP